MRKLICLIIASCFTSTVSAVVKPYPLFNMKGEVNKIQLNDTVDDIYVRITNKVDIVDGSINLKSYGSLYFGDTLVDGTWRIVRSGDNLVIERRESGAWVTKMTVTP